MQKPVENLWEGARKHSEGARRHLKGSECLTSLSEATRTLCKSAWKHAEASRKPLGGRPEAFGGRAEAFERKRVPNVAFWSHQKTSVEAPGSMQKPVETPWGGARKHSEGARRHLKGSECLTSLSEATRKPLWKAPFFSDALPLQLPGGGGYWQCKSNRETNAY